MTAVEDRPVVSGRAEPRPDPKAAPVEHEIRLYGTRGDPPDFRAGLSAECSCGTGWFLEPGHTDLDIAKLGRQHRGEED